MKLLTLLFLPTIYYTSKDSKQYKENTNEQLKRLHHMLSPTLYYKRSCYTKNDCLENEKCCYTQYKDFCCTNSEYMYYTLKSLE